MVSTPEVFLRNLQKEYEKVRKSKKGKHGVLHQDAGCPAIQAHRLSSGAPSACISSARTCSTPIELPRHRGFSQYARNGIDRSSRSTSANELFCVGDQRSPISKFILKHIHDTIGANAMPIIATHGASWVTKTDITTRVTGL